MSTPPAPDKCANDEGIMREEWDKCIRHGTWRVAIGLILGAIGSSILVSEMPMVVGTGLGIGWAVRHCKSLLRGTDSAESRTSSDPSEADPCSCCNSNFEALDAYEFEGGPPQSPPPHQNKDTAPQENNEEEKCTCRDVPLTWSTPRPAEEFIDHPVGCSCFQ